MDIVCSYDPCEYGSEVVKPAICAVCNADYAHPICYKKSTKQFTSSEVKCYDCVNTPITKPVKGLCDDCGNKCPVKRIYQCQSPGCFAERCHLSTSRKGSAGPDDHFCTIHEPATYRYVCTQIIYCLFCLFFLI